MKLLKAYHIKELINLLIALHYPLQSSTDFRVTSTNKNEVILQTFFSHVLTRNLNTTSKAKIQLILGIITLNYCLLGGTLASSTFGDFSILVLSPFGENRTHVGLLKNQDIEIMLFFSSECLHYFCPTLQIVQSRFLCFLLCNVQHSQKFKDIDRNACN